MSTYNTTIEIFNKQKDDYEEINIEVSYNYYRACRGYRDKYGAPEEPDEPAYIEIGAVINLADGSEVELTDDEIEKLKEKIWSSMESEVEYEPRDRDFPEE